MRSLSVSEESAIPPRKWTAQTTMAAAAARPSSRTSPNTGNLAAGAAAIAKMVCGDSARSSAGGEGGGGRRGEAKTPTIFFSSFRADQVWTSEYVFLREKRLSCVRFLLSCCGALILRKRLNTYASIQKKKKREFTLHMNLDKYLYMFVARQCLTNGIGKWFPTHQKISLNPNYSFSLPFNLNPLFIFYFQSHPTLSIIQTHSPHPPSVRCTRVSVCESSQEAWLVSPPNGKRR